MFSAIDTAVRPAPDEPAPTAGRLVRTVSRLFPAAVGKSVTWYWMLLAVAVGTMLSLFRTTGTGALQTIFEEDSRDILTGALDTSSLKAVLTPVQGYFVVGPRLLGELATLFPLSWATAVLSISSAMITALLAVQVYVASGAHLSNRLARIAVAAPLLVAPVAETMFMEIYNRPVCLHFFALYAVFWVLMWTPGTRAGRVGALVTVGLTALSSPLIVGFLPLAALRAFFRRDRLGFVMFGFVLAGSVLQVMANMTGLGGVPRTSSTRLDPVWAAKEYVEWTVPLTLLGRRNAHFDPALSTEAFLPSSLGIMIAWAIVLAVVAVAIIGARRGFLRPAWVLAVALGGQSAAILALQIMVNGWISQRYLMIPALLLLGALIVLLRPAPGAVRPRLAMAPLAVLCLFLAVIAAINYRNDETFRHDAPRWIDQVHRAAQLCTDDPTQSTVVVSTGPTTLPSSYVIVPCHEVRALESPVHRIGP